MSPDGPRDSAAPPDPLPEDLREYLRQAEYIARDTACSHIATAKFLYSAKTWAEACIFAWRRTLRVVIYRTRVHHETRKNFQLDLFDPADGHYEYSAVVTNKPLSGRYLWHFMCGRGGHEKAYGELKSGFAFASVPSLQYAANSAWQQLSVVAFNLMRGFQIAAGLVVERSRSAGRRPLFAFRSIDTLRYELLHRAGIVLHPDGRPTLEVGTTAAVRRQFLAIDNRLPRAA